jgi:proteasome alpha subunit
MTMPFYVAPEQVMKDRAEYAQKGIARGRSLVAATYGSGVLIVAENPSRTLHKISEIYDRVAFAGAGRYNEFDQLRVAGVRHADTKGFAYSRGDVDARSLANLYAQFLGQVFTHEMKPLEVEILVAELDPIGDSHQLYHIGYDGTIVDEEDFTVLGGDSGTISDRLSLSYRPGWPLAEAMRQCVAALAGPDRVLDPSDLEAAVLENREDRRSFRRLTNGELAGMLASPASADSADSAEVATEPTADGVPESSEVAPPAATGAEDEQADTAAAAENDSAGDDPGEPTGLDGQDG